MANVKNISIKCVVPFDWIGRLSDEDAAFLARVLIAPTAGIVNVRGVPSGANKNGGRTAMYEVRIFGQEALAWSAIDRIIELLESFGEDVPEVQCYDMEDVSA
jgi:hypothetical protein